MSPDLTDLNFAGVTPSRQKRSRETMAALLRAGSEMLRTHRLEELSIEALCAKVDATVGAFYSRFDSKEAYFNALLGLAVRDGNALLVRMTQDETLARMNLDSLCGLLVRSVIEWMRAHEGAVRAALHRGDSGPERWNAYNRLGRSLVEGASPLLLRAMGSGDRKSKLKAIGFGFQVVFGTLVNAVLNDPGPLSLHDKEMPATLTRCLVLLLAVETAPTRATRSTGRVPASKTRKRSSPLRSRKK